MLETTKKRRRRPPSPKAARASTPSPDLGMLAIAPFVADQAAAVAAVLQSRFDGERRTWTAAELLKFSRRNAIMLAGTLPAVDDRPADVVGFLLATRQHETGGPAASIRSPRKPYLFLHMLAVSAMVSRRGFGTAMLQSFLRGDAVSHAVKRIDSNFDFMDLRAGVFHFSGIGCSTFARGFERVTPDLVRIHFNLAGLPGVLAIAEQIHVPNLGLVAKASKLKQRDKVRASMLTLFNRGLVLSGCESDGDGGGYYQFSTAEGYPKC